MTAAHVSCHWPAAAWVTELAIVAGYRPASQPTDHAYCSVIDDKYFL